MSHSPSRAGLREWTGLAVLALPTLLVSIDVSVMLLALPHISRRPGRHEHPAALDHGHLRLHARRLHDHHGQPGRPHRPPQAADDRRHRLRLASVLAAFSTTPLMLIAARAPCSVSPARRCRPSILALISNMFPRTRGSAAGHQPVAGSFMGGMAIGPLVGGACSSISGGARRFLLGMPVMLLLLVSAPVLLPEYRAPKPVTWTCSASGCPWAPSCR